MVETAAIVALLVAAVVALFVSAHRHTTFFVARVSGGVLRVVRGRIPAAVLEDLREIVARPPIPSATLSIARDGELARLELAGVVPADQAQRLRNAIGVVPLARLRGALR